MKSKLIFFVLLLPLFIYAQKQVKVDWPSLAKSPWPVLRGDMQGTGRSEYVGPRTYNVKWIKDEPRGVILGPVIGYDENLYFGELAINFGDTYNLFYAVDKNGKDLWTFKSSEFYPNNGGCVLGRDSTIYFHSANGYLYALNKDGKLIWSTYVVQGSSIEFYLDKPGNIYLPVFDTLRVVTPQGDMKGYYYPGITAAMSFSIGGDTIFAVTTGKLTDGTNGALNASDLEGNIYWSFKIAQIGIGIPMVDNQNNIYVFGTDSAWSHKNYLYCIKPNGTLKWKYPMQYLNRYYCPTMDNNGNITFYSPYYMNGDYYGAITSIDYNGNLRWTDSLNLHDYIIHMDYGPVCDKEGKIYCGSYWDGGTFYCIDSNGVILWKNIFPNQYDSCPAIGSDGTLYIGLHQDDLNFEQWSTLYAIHDTITDVKDEKVEPVKDYQLYQNYPNPFNPSTTINYSLPKVGNVKLTVYNILGNKVATVVDEYKSAGNYNVQFNGSNLASGIYLYRLESGSYSATKKLILLK